MNITYQQIMEFNQYYDPIDIGMPKDYSAKISEFIIEYRDKVRDKSDILWILLRPEFMNNKEIRLFSVWCARQVEDLMIDQRSINVLNAAEKYANGKANDSVLYKAWAEAWDAVLYRSGRMRLAAEAAATSASTDIFSNYPYKSGFRDAFDYAYLAANDTKMRDIQIDKLLEIFSKKEYPQKEYPQKEYPQKEYPQKESIFTSIKKWLKNE